MKNLMKTLVLTALAALALTTPNAFAQDGAGIRERLISEESVKLLYAVDETHTFIVGELPENSGEFTVERLYGNDEGQPNGAYMIRHASTEPLAYKNPVIPSYEKIEMPKKGEMKLVKETLDGVKRSYSPIDLYQHMSAVCAKSGGTPAFVITKRMGTFKRLTRVDAVEAFNHLLLTGTIDSAWFIACEGESKFVAEKNYRALTGGIDTADIRPMRALEGVSYVNNNTTLADLTDYPAVVKAADPAEQDRFLKQMAYEVAGMKVDFVKPHEGLRYQGYYSTANDNDGCDIVSIKPIRTSALEDNSNAVFHDFKVCQNRVAKIGVRDMRNPGMYANSGNILAVKISE